MKRRDVPALSQVPVDTERPASRLSVVDPTTSVDMLGELPTPFEMQVDEQTATESRGSDLGMSPYNFLFPKIKGA